MTLAAVFLALLLAACTGTSGVQPAPGAGAVRQAGGGQVFHVRMNPQQPQEPAFRSASFAAPRLFSSHLPASRTVSTEDGLLAVEGQAFDGGLPKNLVNRLGKFCEFSPAYSDADLGGLAYSIYSVTLQALPPSPTLGVHWDASNSPAAHEAWIAFSDWSRDRWVWYEAPLDGVITIASYEDYADGKGRILVAVAVAGAERRLLEMLAFGEPEARGTGGIGNPGSAKVFPPLYQPELPARVDLTPGCAPVNDQMTWGSCTAFGVGDGAYNYELGQIYGGLGWDLGDPAMRLSPKYLYVVSGERGGFPPGGDYGRWTDEVATCAQLDGVASEQHAPYNLVYDNNWTPEALADAALLKIDGFEEIPCTTPEGIKSVKAVLALQSRPLFMQAYLDYQFLYYSPGEVWQYSGPTIGGHAMCIVGYDDSKAAFKVRNSWSADWGDRGYCWISYATFQNYWAGVRCWVLHDSYDDAVAQRFLGLTDPLPPPAGLAASDGEFAGKVQLSWQAVPGATGYRIYRDIRTNMIAEVGAVVQADDTGVSDAYSHAYWITALQGSTESAQSASDLGFLSQGPTILGVQPEGGATGQQVTFVAQAYGGGDLTFSWDFGGGATPGSSTDQAPQVVLGAEGTYSASVEVTNSEGSDTYPFSLVVGPRLSPIALITVSPSSGNEPLTVRMDGAQSYDPDGQLVSYHWKEVYQASVVWEYTTTTPVCDRVLTGAGQHDLWLEVTDSDNLVASATAYVNVIPDNYSPTGNFNYSINSFTQPFDYGFSASTYDPDGTIVLYEWDFDGDGVYEESGAGLTHVHHLFPDHGEYIVGFRCTDDDGATGSVENTLEVGLGNLPPGWSAHGLDQFSYADNIYAKAAVISGRPGIACFSEDDNALYFYYADSASPQGPGDWTKETISTSSPGNFFSLIDDGGRAVASFEDRSTGSLMCAIRNGGTWNTHTLHDPASGTVGSHCTLARINGRLAVAYDVSADDSFWYAYATVATPAGPGDWSKMEISPGIHLRESCGITELNGLPYIAFAGNSTGSGKQLGFARATTASPAVPADWVWHFFSQATDVTSVSIMVTDGKPIIVRGDNGGENGIFCCMGLTATPGNETDWGQYCIDGLSNPVQPCAASVGGAPAAVYRATWTTMLATPIISPPQSYFQWHREQLLFLVPPDVHAVLDVGGKTAAVLSLNESPVIYYLAQD